MRELKNSEQAALKQARIVWLEQITVVNKGMSESHKAGFIAALDYNAERIAALTAERTQLRAESDALRAALENMLYIFDNGYDKADSLGRMRCDEARRVLGE